MADMSLSNSTADSILKGVAEVEGTFVAVCAPSRSFSRILIEVKKNDCDEDDYVTVRAIARQIAIKCELSLEKVSYLLEVLKEFKLDVPQDPRTL
ncbi:unnamed protein product [Echinostoma caproni]|uniref:Ras-associating domain-containing protein n=1 Tax=Echinostoma caproni TaxID=27848 RepID=A0A183B151_9TREM|nr:unnamed protein product [Echinostoma caproni]